MQGMPMQVEQREHLDRASFEREFVRTQTPVIIQNLTRSWAAYGRWSFDRAISVGRRREVQVHEWEGGVSNFILRQMTLEELVSQVRNSASARDKYYIAQTPLGEVLPELADEIALPPLFEQSRLCGTLLFMGVDTYTAPHYHMLDNQAILAPVVGSKRVILFSASDHARLRPPKWYATGAALLRHNWSQLAFHRGASLDDIVSCVGGAEPYECTLHAGDALFIPSHAFHIVYGLGETLAVTFFWRGTFLRSGVPFRVMARDLLIVTNLLLHVVGLKAAERFGTLDRVLALARRKAVLDDAQVEAVRRAITPKRRDSARAAPKM